MTPESVKAAVLAPKGAIPTALLFRISEAVDPVKSEAKAIAAIVNSNKEEAARQAVLSRMKQMATAQLASTMAERGVAGAGFALGQLGINPAMIQASAGRG